MPVNNFVSILPIFFFLCIYPSSLNCNHTPTQFETYNHPRMFIAVLKIGSAVVRRGGGCLSSFKEPSPPPASRNLVHSFSHPFPSGSNLTCGCCPFCHIALKLEARRGRESLFSKKQRAFKDETLSCAVRNIISAQVRKHTLRSGCLVWAWGYFFKACLTRAALCFPLPQLSPSHQHLNFEAKVVKLNDNVDGRNLPPPREGVVVVVRSQVLYRWQGILSYVLCMVQSFSLWASQTRVTGKDDGSEQGDGCRGIPRGPTCQSSFWWFQKSPLSLSRFWNYEWFTPAGNTGAHVSPSPR